MIGSLDMRHANEIDAAGVDDDELGPFAQTLLKPRRKDRMTVGRVRAHDHHDIGILDRIEILGARRRSEGRFQAIASGRVADTAQVSTLLLPKPARISFWTRKVSSLVQREEVMPPTAFRPYFAWMRLNSLAVWLIASSQLTSRHGSLMRSADHRLRMRSWWVA